MEITSVAITENNTQLTVTITDAADVVSLRFWNNHTYKDFSQAIDFSSKLTGSATETITVTLTDINEDFFDGIYFFEAEDSNETSVNYAANLTKYKECIIDHIVRLSVCDSCFEKQEVTVINAHSLLTALEYSLTERFIDEALSIIRTLDKFCEGECKTCGSYGNIKSVDTNEGNFNTVTIKLDGGSLD